MSTPSELFSSPAKAGIDPRGPRFGAAITAVLLLIVVFLALSGASVAALVLLIALAALFAWGAFAGAGRHPYGLLFRSLIRPRLAPPSELEDPAPPTFAQGVGLLVTLVGVILGLVGLHRTPSALPRQLHSSRPSSMQCSTTAPAASSTYCSCAHAFSGVPERQPQPHRECFGATPQTETCG